MSRKSPDKNPPLLVDEGFIKSLSNGNPEVLRKLPSHNFISSGFYIEDIFFSSKNPNAEQLASEVLENIKQGDYLAMRGNLNDNQYVFAVCRRED